jgi:hypothetical protein
VGVGIGCCGGTGGLIKLIHPRSETPDLGHPYVVNPITYYSQLLEKTAYIPEFDGIVTAS